MSITALSTYLEPLQAIFEEEDVSEISLNQPGEAWIEKRGEMEYRELAGFDLEHMKSLARLIAQFTEQMVSEERPLLSATLPQGFRVQVVFPPACEPGRVVMSIRKQTILDLDLDAYEALGAFQNTAVLKQDDPAKEVLIPLLREGQIKEFIHQAVLLKQNIIISGGTSTGKTTFMNAALKAIPEQERIITAEDAREIQIAHIPNRVHLLSSRGEQGLAKVTPQDLIETCLRLRPDRIMVGELRGSEAFTFLRAINTSHPGSVTTLHADTPLLAFEQLSLMVMQAGLGIARELVREYIDSIIDIVIQLRRGDKGRRFVSEIYYRPLEESLK